MATSFLAQSLNLRSLAVASAERLASMPQVPTVEELGLGRLASVTYGGLFVRAGTPEAVTSRLEDACRRVVEGAPFREVAEKQVVRATYLGRAELGRRMAADEAVVGALIRELRLQE